MKKLIFLKLGGSLITDKEKPYTARVDIIKNLANQIKEALTEDPTIQLIIGNGAGSFAHYAATKYNYPIHKNSDNFKEAFASIQHAAIRLNRIVVDECMNIGLPAMSVHPSSFIVTKKGKTEHICVEPIVGMLKVGMIPVVHGDCLYDSIIGAHIYSTEKVFEAVIESFSRNSILVEKIIQATVVEGIFDKNKAVIPHISKKNLEVVKKSLFSPTGFDVTGGMLHKIEQSLRMADLGIKNYIVNGLEKDIVKNALLGKKVKGTQIY